MTEGLVSQTSGCQLLHTVGRFPMANQTAQAQDRDGNHSHTNGVPCPYRGVQYGRGPSIIFWRKRGLGTGSAAFLKVYF